MNVVWGGADRPDLRDALAGWAAAHIGIERGFGPCTAMGVFDKETLVAVMVYNNFYRKEGVIEMHGAGITPRWLTKPVLWEMFNFPFNVLGCQMLVMRVSERNTRLLRILTAYGFDHVLIPRLRGRDEGERIFTLTDDAWRSNRFHEGRH